MSQTLNQKANDRVNDTEIELVLGDYRAVLAPYGASMRRFFSVDTTGQKKDYLWGYSSASAKQGGQGDVLIPFPGRVPDGQYTFGGKIHQLECNDKESHGAIHGFLRKEEWSVLHRDAVSVEFGYRLLGSNFVSRGYPFSVDFKLAYRLVPAGLTCQFSAHNIGQGPAPVGVGFHSYFKVGTDLIDQAQLEVPAEDRLELDSTLQATGRVLHIKGTAFDFTQLKTIGSQRLNTCYASLQAGKDGVVRTRLRNPSSSCELEIWQDEQFPYLVVYTGDALDANSARTSIAIEPMTCGINALNRPEWGLKVLKSGEEWNGKYGFRVHAP